MRVDPRGENYWEQASTGDYIKIVGDTYYEQLNDWFRCTEIGFEFTEGNKEIMLYTFTPNTTGVQWLTMGKVLRAARTDHEAVLRAVDSLSDR